MKIRWIARRQSLVNQSGDFEVNLSVDWEQVKLVYKVLNKRSTQVLILMLKYLCVCSLLTHITLDKDTVTSGLVRLLPDHHCHR